MAEIGAMGRVLRTIALAVVAAALVPGLASAKQAGDGGGADRAFCAPAGAPDPTQCSFPVGPETVTLDFDATSGPLGESPTGSARVVVGPIVTDFDVTCLQVAGDLAAIGGIITSTNNPGFQAGSGFAFKVLDDPLGPDLISAVEGGLPVPEANTPACGSLFAPFFPVDGDIVVEDAQCDKFKDKPGTEKDRCKN